MLVTKLLMIQNSIDGRYRNRFPCGIVFGVQFEIVLKDIGDEPTVQVVGGHQRARKNISSAATSFQVQYFDTIFQSLEEQLFAINNNLDKIKGSAAGLNSIALQTKLISFNARIEAAHAGDNGKSFAVVATEIKNLADKSEAIIMSNDVNQTNILTHGYSK